MLFSSCFFLNQIYIIQWTSIIDKRMKYANEGGAISPQEQEQDLKDAQERYLSSLKRKYETIDLRENPIQSC